MNIDPRSVGFGFVAGLAIAAAAAQAMQGGQNPAGQSQPEAAVTSQPKAGPMQGMGSDRMMMDPAMRQQMMERMQQCQDMMSRMMAHMQAMHGMQPGQPTRREDGDHSQDRPPQKK